MIQEKQFDEFLNHIEKLELIPSDTKEFLKARNDSFAITGVHRKGVETVTYSLQVEKNENLRVYQTDGYHLSMFTIGDIAHREIMGVDTAKLEQLMQKVDWSGIMPVDIRHNQRVSECLIKLATISAQHREDGVNISELLTLKYLVGTPLGALFEFSDFKKQYEKTLFVELNGNAQDIGLIDSYNIICGRGVAKPLLSEKDDSKICWLAMRDAVIIKLPDFNLSSHLLKLPFAEKRSVVDIAEDITKLCNGEQVEGKFRVSGQLFSAFFEADPLIGELAFRDQKQNRFDLKTLTENPDRLKALVNESKQPRKGLGL